MTYPSAVSGHGATPLANVGMRSERRLVSSAIIVNIAESVAEELLIWRRVQFARHLRACTQTALETECIPPHETHMLCCMLTTRHNLVYTMCVFTCSPERRASSGTRT